MPIQIYFIIKLNLIGLTSVNVKVVTLSDIDFVKVLIFTWEISNQAIFKTRCKTFMSFVDIVLMS